MHQLKRRWLIAYPSQFSFVCTMSPLGANYAFSIGYTMTGFFLWAIFGGYIYLSRYYVVKYANTVPAFKRSLQLTMILSILTALAILIAWHVLEKPLYAIAALAPQIILGMPFSSGLNKRNKGKLESR